MAATVGAIQAYCPGSTPTSPVAAFATISATAARCFMVKLPADPGMELGALERPYGNRADGCAKEELFVLFHLKRFPFWLDGAFAESLFHGNQIENEKK